MYLSEDAFIPRYYDKTVNLKDLVQNIFLNFLKLTYLLI